MADAKSAAKADPKMVVSDIEKMTFLGDVLMDNMMTAMIALTAEVWADRRRVRVMEKLLAQKGITSEMIEKYMPTAEDSKAWEEDRKVLVERVFDQFAVNHGEFGVASPWQKK